MPLDKFGSNKDIANWDSGKEEEKKVDINTKAELTSIKDSAGSDLDTQLQQKLQQKPLIEVMDYLGIPSSYSDRYNLIHQLFDNGVIIFDGSLNPYVRDVRDPSSQRMAYIGNEEQNAKLKSQIIKNYHLFKNGKLSTEDVANWNSGKGKEEDDINAKAGLTSIKDSAGSDLGKDINKKYEE